MPEHVDLTVAGGSRRPAEVFVPEAPAAAGFPGVVVLHDIFGLKDDTRRHCQNLVAAGYAAIAPDLYDGGAPRCVVSTMTSALRGQGEALEVIEAARNALAARPDVDADRIGVTGFCMGGGFALLAAADGCYAVAAPFYGVVPTSAERLRGICPTLAQFGRRDRVFVSHAERLARHLQTLGVEHEVIIYEGAGHSFMNDHPGPLFALGRHGPLRAAHDPETEAKAWGRLLDFFERHMPAAEAAPQRL